jgi:hypothetical protein
MHRLAALALTLFPATAFAYDPIRFAEPPPPPCPEVVVQPAALVTARPHRVSLGLRAARLEIDGQEAAGVGVLLHYRMAPQLDLELEVGRDVVGDTGRVDARYGVGLDAYLGSGTVAPYLMVGTGVIAIHEPCGDGRREGFLSAGGGVAVRLSDRLSVAGEVRWSVVSGEDSSCPVEQSDGREHMREARLEARFSF